MYKLVYFPLNGMLKTLPKLYISTPVSIEKMNKIKATNNGA